ncbi:MAG TPA: hypothetical protein VMG34_02555, partial [Bacteroidota bacterium]|nr:hypothetical protein [Bacteroidota bacterium]
MIHFEDKTLELFVLGAPDSDIDRRGIEAHLEVCASCRKRKEEIASYYAEVRSELRDAESNAEPVEMLPARRHESTLQAYFERFESMERGARRPVSIRMWDSVRMHPYRYAGVGLLAGIVLLAVLVVLPSRISNTGNLSYYKIDKVNGFIKLYNNQNVEEWGISAPIESVADPGGIDRYIKIADLRGDGRTEVVYLGPAYYQGSMLPWGIKIFGPSGALQHELPFQRTQSFRWRDYSGNYEPRGLDLFPSGKNKALDIFCTMTSFRSPSVLARISNSGEVIGEYWHFGNL